MIYAIRSGSNGPVKLGYAKNPRKRLSQLQVAHYEPLFLLASEDTKGSDGDVEEWMHGHYKDDRIRGEWFKPSERVLRLVERMKIGQAVNDITREEARITVTEHRTRQRKKVLWLIYAGLKEIARRMDKPKRVTLAEYLRLREQNGSANQ